MNGAVDVSRWSRTHSDRVHPMWWGVWGLIAVEMTVVSMFLAGFFYVWIANSALMRSQWAFGNAEIPDSVLPGINLALLGVCGWSMWYGGVVMKQNRGRAFAWLAVLCCVCAALVLGLRWLQMARLPFRMGESSYASFVWVLSGFHFLHVASALVGTAVIGWLAYKGYYNSRRMLGVQLDTMYWYFVCGVWAPLYFCLYWAPRLL